jgi:hypothetical protein
LPSQTLLLRADKAVCGYYRRLAANSRPAELKTEEMTLLITQNGDFLEFDCDCTSMEI